MSGSHDFEPIKPAELPLTQNTPASGDPVPWQQRRSTWLALAVCVLLALLVIFVLPSLVKTPDQPPVLIETTGQPAPALAESPFRDAQLASARRAAQDVLAKILEKKTFLEDNNVDQWGDEAMSEALQQAAAGDRDYRQRNFELAQASYQKSLELLQALEDSIPERLTAALQAGQQALESGDAELAKKQFDLALAIDPGNTDATSGHSRAGVLDQVNELLQRAGLAVTNNQLDDARELFNQALTLDALSKQAQEGLQSVEHSLRDHAFNDAMSRGFSALESNQLTQAKKAFREALALKPDDEAARTGLAQATNTATKQSIQALMTKASGQEAAEQWHQAVDSYSRALAIDSSLMAARLGQLRSQARADLDDRIIKVLADPLRLSSSKVLQQSRQVLADARGIKSPGTRLTGQIARLDQVLKAAVTPQTVEFLSDSDTSVTLYRVGELGQFNRKQLTLVPGNYVAVGSRPGYRDVRVEFQVAQDGREKPVIVVCTEPVS
ncbi:MAG: hypothetical protein EP334_08405 [Gammaproteobacteria bacterium]|nr:MAG: hypothetical protein EP334_08405 [Gammaproteobacteria bacterium]